MPRERWKERAQARARRMRDAYRASRAGSAAPPAEPPVETGADPDLGDEEASSPVAGARDEESPGPVPAGGSKQLALDGVEGPPPPGPDDDPLADSDADPEPAPPEVSDHQQELPPAGSAGVGIGERLAGVGYEARGALSDGRHWASERWGALPSVARHRVLAGLIVAFAALLVVFVLIPAAPCGFPGGDRCPPPDDAIDLVPGDALAYAHLDLDPESEQYEAAAELADRLPVLSSLALSPASRLVGGRLAFGDVGPWAGSEAALAVLPAGAGTGTAALIEVDDAGAADAFAAAVVGPAPRSEDAGGVEVSVGRRGQAAAQVDGFLVIGDAEAVRAIADPADGAGELAAEAEGATSDLPDDRFAYAYLSGGGARALLSRPSLRPLDTFVDSAAAADVAAALSVEGDAVRLTVRSSLDPDRAESAPGFFAALPPFEPTLTSDVNPDALAYLGVGEPGNSIQSLLSQASTEAPELRRAYVRFAQQLRKRGGINVSADLLPLLGTQSALSVEPVTAAAAETPGVAASAGVPYVTLLAEGVDSEAAAADLASLQQPLAEALVPRSGVVGGRVVGFEPVQIAGTEAQSLAMSRNIELTYATYDDRLAVSTDPLGIAQARAGGDGLDDTDGFEEVTGGFPTEVSLLAYLDLRGLISLGEQIGLATDPGYAQLAPDLRSLEAAALGVADDGDEIRTDVTLSIGEPEGAQVESSPLPGD